MATTKAEAKAEVVFVSTPALGNLVPIVEFTHHLTSLNPYLSATVLIITLPQRPLLTSYTLSRATSSSTRFLHLPTVDPPAPDQYQSSIALTSLYIQKHKHHVRQAIMELKNKTTLAGFFVDMFSTTLIDVADELDVPCYLFFASPAAFLGFMLELPSLEGVTRCCAELDVASFANKVPREVLPSAVLKCKDGLTWLCYHGRRYRETRGILVNSFVELEPHAIGSLVKMSGVPKVFPIGPVIDLDGPAQWYPDKAQQESVVRWLDNQPDKSVVFLCFGSMGSLSGHQAHEIAVGLERAQCRFLWSIREQPKVKFGLPSDYTNLEEVLPKGFVDRTAEIGLVCGWVPQVNVLAHRAIGGFISHCGWNSILEGIWYGVPIATWPVYAEQQMNAFEMVRELGLAGGIRLDYRDGGDLVLAEEVAREVKKLMDDGNELRKRVREMGEKGRRALMENGSSYESSREFIGKLMCNVGNSV